MAYTSPNQPCGASCKANKHNSDIASKKRKSDRRRESTDVTQLTFNRPQPRKKPRAGAGDAAGPPASRPCWVAAAVLFVAFDEILDGCHMRDAFDGRLDEREWDMNEFQSELRMCAC